MKHDEPPASVFGRELRDSLQLDLAVSWRFQSANSSVEQCGARRHLQDQVGVGGDVAGESAVV